MNDKKLLKGVFPGTKVSGFFEVAGLLPITHRLTFLWWGRVCLIAILLVGYGFNSSWAQDRVDVSGTVTDASDGTTIPGVNVVVQGSEELTGSTIGSVTNIDGEYTVQVPEGLNILVFSFVGYQTQTVIIDGRSVVNVELHPDIQFLDDVVVVGYGTQERRQVTGSIASVSSEDFITGNVNNPAELLQGKVPGLMVTSPGGNPNQPATLRLRGLSSFGNNEPLIVVDGIIGASLDNIDPNDIESIDVLKDASAAAIYGTRGGAGVVAITTKKGQVGSTSVNYHGSFSFLGVENKLDVLSASEFRELSRMSGFDINDLEHSTDWFDVITQTGYNQIHNLSIAGGSENTTYRISGNLRDNRGMLKTTGFDQKGGRVYLNHRTLDNKLSLELNLSATSREEDRSFNDAFEYAATFNPTAPVTAPGHENTGGFVEIDAFRVFNPLAIVETAENIAEIRTLNTAFQANYQLDDFIPGLAATAFYSLETGNFVNNLFWSRSNKFQGAATTSSLGRGRAERITRDHKTEQFEAYLNYISTVADRLNLEAWAGYSFQEAEEQGTGVAGGDFISDAVGSSNLGFVQDFNQGLGNVESFRNSNRLIGTFGRVSLNWDNTWFLNASIRREGSSRFGANNQWGTFWSAGARVDVTNLVEMDLFDHLSFRGSFGVSGQDAPFDGISRMRFAPRGSFFVGGEFAQSFGPISNDNPDLKWEETSEFNIGMDVALLDERLTATFDYYEKTTSDLIFEIDVAVPPNLFPRRWENVGDIETKGFEATVGFDVVRNTNTTWNSRVLFETLDITLARFDSDVARFLANVGSPGQNNTQQVRIRQGEPIGQIWGPKFAEIDENGEWLFFNESGDLITSDEIAREDERVIGNAIPDFTLGWQNSLRHRNWDVSVFFRGVFGHDLVNSARVFFENPSNIGNYNVVSSAMDFVNLTSEPAYNSLHVEDATFVRFENFTIGYNVPLSNNSLIHRLRFYVAGNNLFTITDYKGIDPEVRWVDVEDNNNPLSPGIERRAQWYTVRSFTAGVNIDF